MRTQTQLNGFLPLNTQNVQTVGAFSAGDDRVNEMPGLTSMHNCKNEISFNYIAETNFKLKKLVYQFLRVFSVLNGAQQNRRAVCFPY